MTNYYPVSSSSLAKSRNTETFCIYLNYGRKIYIDSINYLVIKGNFCEVHKQLITFWLDYLLCTLYLF